jgi:quercetin dioxygenase-like cupin family protein
LAIHKIEKGNITMKKLRILRLLLTGLFVSCAFFTTMSGRALATPPEGVTDLLVVGPIAFDEIDIHSFTPTHFAEIETLGQSDVYIIHRTIDPGGHTGWHSHPGVALVTVISGDATEFSGDDPSCTPLVHHAGSGFTEEAGHVHIVRNEGSTELEVLALYLVPSGQAPRIDQPDPGNCP